MQLTLAEAAKAVGKSKSTVLRSIRSGRISAARDELTGGWLIEPVELHRCYAPDAVRGAPDDTPRNSDDASELRARLADAQDQIADLRRRLDRADEQRQAAQTQLTALLAAPARPWWRRVIR